MDTNQDEQGKPAREAGQPAGAPHATESDTPAAEPPRSPWVKLAIETGPLVAFFVTNAKAGIFAATGVFMVAIVISLAASWKLEKRLPPMALFTAVFVLVFGGLTIYLEDELFIKLKPTIVNGLFAVILGGGLMAGKLLLRHAFGEAFRLTEEGWRLLTLRWIGFFILLAILNEIVRRHVTTDTWVTFKTFGIMPLTFVFTITLLPLINKHQLDEPNETGA